MIRSAVDVRPWGQARKLALIALLALACIATPEMWPHRAAAIDVAWTKVDTPSPAADVSIGSGGEVWIVLADNRIARLNGAAFEVVDGTATRVAAGAGGNVWMVDTNRNGYRRQNNAWERQFAVQRAVDIVAGANGTLWYTDQRGYIYNWIPQESSGSRTQATLNAARITMGNDGKPWAVTTANEVIRYVNDAVQTLPSPPGLKVQDIASGANGAIWITASDDSIWRFTGTGWDRAPGLARTISVAPDGTLWVVNAGGDLFRGAPAGETAPQPVIAAGAPAPANVTNRPVVGLLCKLAGTADEPRSAEQVQAILTGPNGLDAYMREVSYGAVTLEGTRAFGWFQVPGDAAQYTQPANSNDSGPWRKLADDCSAAAPQVAFPDNAVIAFFTNGEIGTQGSTFSHDLTRDGARKQYRVMMFSTSGLTGPALVAHELGHIFGMGHTCYGDLGGTFVVDGCNANSWDPMGSAPLGNPLNTANPLGIMGPGFGAYHRERSGWLPTARKFVYAGTQQQVKLTRLSQPTTNDFLMAQVQIGAGPIFYSVELRSWAGADAAPRGQLFGNALPGEAVIIHRIDPNGRDIDAWTIGPVTGREAADAGAMWKAGQTFTDAANNITIRIDEIDILGGTATVTIGPANP